MKEKHPDPTHCHQCQRKLKKNHVIVSREITGHLGFCDLMCEERWWAIESKRNAS